MSKEFVPSRRQLIAGGAVLAAAVPGLSIPTAGAKPFAMQDLDDWQAHVGKHFSVNGTAMRLVSVNEGKRQPYGVGRKYNFATVFEVAGDRIPEAGVHTVSHAQLGQADFYLEPTVSNKGKARLRAAFN